MSVRAKMSPNGSMRGTKGATLYLNAVYEGSDELMGISENSIFGSSTPTGSLQIDGEFPVEKFSENTNMEYYVDIFDPSEADNAADQAYLFVFPARCFYESLPNATYSGVTFKYAPLGAVAGQLYMAINNQPAIDWLHARENVIVAIKPAWGRRSDAEIKAREKMLEDAIALAEKHWPANEENNKHHGREQTKEQHIEQMTSYHRLKLRRAQGEQV